LKASPKAILYPSFISSGETYLSLLNIRAYSKQDIFISNDIHPSSP
jgi:hypothetical protein